MIFESKEEVFKFIEDNLKVCSWVSKAREERKILNALVYGVKFSEVLIEQIEHIEADARGEARRKYSKDIRDLFYRSNQPRENVFSAFGGSTISNFKSERVKEKFLESINQFKGQKSLNKYLSENFFQLADVDPNGINFVEYMGDEDIYPTYKSIDDIRIYESNGNLLNYILFEPKDVEINNVMYKEWRLVDSKTDWRILQNGAIYTEYKEKTFKHPFSNVPAVILSDIKETGSELRRSYLFFVTELAKDYARDKSVNTIYKFINGFVRHWRYENVCKACHGEGKTGRGESCSVCLGVGYARKSDVTDTTIINMPKNKGDDVIISDPEGFVQPALDTWRQYNEDLIEMEKRVKSTLWGTDEVSRGGNETATGRFIDLQPITSKLSKYTDHAEWVSNQFCHFVEDWINSKPKLNYEYHEVYGRRYIIEGPDIILERYTKERDKGANVTILDKILEEYILSLYKSSPKLTESMKLKKDVEPYVHQSVKEVNDIFGMVEANKKVLFVDFWQTVNKEGKTAQELRKEFSDYFNNNNLITKEVENNI